MNYEVAKENLINVMLWMIVLALVIVGLKWEQSTYNDYTGSSSSGLSYSNSDYDEYGRDYWQGYNESYGYAH